MSSSSKWHYLYTRKNWLKRRAHQLRIEPICSLCKREPATVADHVVPHKGDVNKFMLGKLMSLCASCHSSTKAIVEKRGYSTAIGPDGLPTDLAHPANRGRG
jgi:5-methylcytosine-specific restriction enzyme A